MVEAIGEALGIPDLLVRVVIAMAIGGLVGLEREKESKKFAGLRTMALFCGSAPLVVAVAELVDAALVVAVYLSLAVMIALSIAYIRFTLTGGDIGFTTSVTVFLVALLGLLVGYGRVFEATSIGIIAAFLLTEKELLVGYVDRLTYRELRDFLKVGALVFILFPILPATPIDPLGVVNPREVLLFAIFVLLIEFTSYVSMRQFGGTRGLHVTGLLAGGANSFATAGVMARIANRDPDAIDSASSSLLLASISMIIRNVAIASILAVALLGILWKPALAMVMLAIMLAGLWWRRGETAASFDIDIDSPFSFTAAAKFAAVFVGIIVVSVVAQDALGEVGLYGTAFLGGLVSSAAVSVTAASVVNNGSVGVEVGAGMVILGIVASLCSKIVLIELVNGKMRTKATLPMVAIAAGGLAVYLVG